jgi:hypothetical protein
MFGLQERYYWITVEDQSNSLLMVELFQSEELMMNTHRVITGNFTSHSFQRIKLMLMILRISTTLIQDGIILTMVLQNIPIFKLEVKNGHY